MDFDEVGSGEVLKVRIWCKANWPNPPKGRIQGGEKLG